MLICAVLWTLQHSAGEESTWLYEAPLRVELGKGKTMGRERRRERAKTSEKREMKQNHERETTSMEQMRELHSVPSTARTLFRPYRDKFPPCRHRLARGSIWVLTLPSVHSRTVPQHIAASNYRMLPSIVTVHIAESSMPISTTR